MKKRRTLIIALLLVATLAIGLGYAATTGTLIVDGTVTTQDQPFNMTFTGYEDVTAETTQGVVGVPGTYGDRVISLNVTGMTKKDDKLVGRFTVTNNNEFPMYLTGITTTGGYDTTVFTVTPELDNPNAEIAVGGTATFTVTVVLNKGISEGASYDFEVIAQATSVNPNS